MRSARIASLALAVAAVLGTAVGGSDPKETTPAKAKAALRPFNDLVGEWRGTGTPEGTQAEKQRGFWTESIAWTWRFKGADVSLVATVEKGKHFTAAELRAGPGPDEYRLSVTGVDGSERTYLGKLADRQLLTEWVDSNTGEAQRLVVNLLHSNRFLYRLEGRAPGKQVFTKLYTVGATRKGEAFAAGPSGPTCIVTGGVGTLTVTHQGKTYYVCCSGCRDEFRTNPTALH